MNWKLIVGGAVLLVFVAMNIKYLLECHSEALVDFSRVMDKAIPYSPHTYGLSPDFFAGLAFSAAFIGRCQWMMWEFYWGLMIALSALLCYDWWTNRFR